MNRIVTLIGTVLALLVIILDVAGVGSNSLLLLGGAILLIGIGVIVNK